MDFSLSLVNLAHSTAGWLHPSYCTGARQEVKGWEGPLMSFFSELKQA